MSKTSFEIYEEIEALDGSDTDILVTQQLLKLITLGFANMAGALESIRELDNGPVVTPTAASLYLSADEYSSTDRSPISRQEILKHLGMIIAKAAGEAESIRAGKGEQAFIQEANVNLSLVPSTNLGPDEFDRDFAASITAASSIDKIVIPNIKAASSTLSSVLGDFVIRKELSVSIAATPSVVAV